VNIVATLRWFLIGVGLGVLISEKVRYKDAHPEGAGQKQYHAQRKQHGIVRLASDSAKDHHESNERKHRKSEKRYWNISLCLSAFSLFFAFFGIAVASVAFYQTRRQADAAVVTSRPWVSFEIAPAGELSWLNGEGRLKLNTSVRNLGRSPALRVKRAIFPIVGASALLDADKICERLKQKDFESTGSMLFLDKGDDTSVTGLPYEAVFKMPNAPRGKALFGKDSQQLFILACVLYGFGDGRSHETRRIIRVMRSGGTADVADTATPVEVMDEVGFAYIVLRDRPNSGWAD
jgi:hypothetical protein